MAGSHNIEVLRDHVGRATTKLTPAPTPVLFNDHEPIRVGAMDFLFGPGIDEALASHDGLDGSYYVIDGLLSVTGALASSSGLKSQVFDVWGVLRAGGIDHLGFTGRNADASGRMDYRFRHYDPSIGRFVSEDPIAIPMRLVDAHVYSYVRNGRTVFIDPFGLICTTTIKTGGLQHIGQLRSYKWDQVTSKQAGPEEGLPKATPPPGAGKAVKSAGKGAGVPWTTSMCLWQLFLRITDYYVREYMEITTCSECPPYQDVHNYWTNESHYTEKKVGPIHGTPQIGFGEGAMVGGGCQPPLFELPPNCWGKCEKLTKP